jgi:alpha-beta hydrolase superfamily lysophospholipase
LLYAFLIYLGICVVYFFLQEKFIFVPVFPGERFETKLATPVEEFHIDTPNKGRIHAVLLHVKEPKGLVIYLHGNTGSLRRWQFMAEEVASYGFDVFACDYRGYGQSHGPRRESYIHRDIEFCYDMLTERFPGLPIIIYGRSLGSGFAVRLAARRKPTKLVLETPFYNLLDVANAYVPFLPVRMLLRFRFRSDYHIHHVDCPIHIFHGTKDIVVPYSSALKLFREVEGKKEIHMTTIVGGRHSTINYFPLFRDKMKEFLHK